MKFNVLYLFVIASISGVIGSDSDGPKMDPIIINKENHTDVPTASTLPANEPNSTTAVPTTTVPSKPTTVSPTTTPPSNATTTVPTTTPPSNATTTAPTTPTPTPPKPSNGTTTAKPTISTTESTTVVPTGAPSHKGRKFDGPSFIGGIILASGLMAICFVSWKFYKARTERNYHTL